MGLFKKFRWGGSVQKSVSNNGAVIYKPKTFHVTA